MLDELGIARASFFETSMGGMIAQVLATEHLERVVSLVSMMSSTGDPAVGQPTPAALEALLTPVPPGREAHLAAALRIAEAIGSPGHLDPERIRREAGGRSIAGSTHPDSCGSWRR